MDIRDEKQTAFEQFCVWFENHVEDGLYTVDDLYKKLKDDFTTPGSGVYVKRYFRDLLVSRFEDSIYISDDGKRNAVVCFKDDVPEIVRKFTENAAFTNEYEIMNVCAKILQKKIKISNMNAKVYPSPENLSELSPEVPEELRYFLSHFFKKPELQDIVKAMRPRSGPLPFLLGLGVELDHQFGSKWLIDRFHGIGLSESYKEVMNYKWNVLKNDQERRSGRSNPEPLCPIHLSGSSSEEESDEDDTDGSGSVVDEELLSVSADITIPSETSNSAVTHTVSDMTGISRPISQLLLSGELEIRSQEIVDQMQWLTLSTADDTRIGEQFVAENIDIQLSSVYGKSSLHAMARMKLKKKSEPCTNMVPRLNIKPDERKRLAKNLDVPRVPFYPGKVDPLSTYSFSPINQIFSQYLKPEMMSYGDLAWIAG